MQSHTTLPAKVAQAVAHLTDLGYAVTVSRSESKFSSVLSWRNGDFVWDEETGGFQRTQVESFSYHIVAKYETGNGSGLLDATVTANFNYQIKDGRSNGGRFYHGAAWSGLSYTHTSVKSMRDLLIKAEVARPFSIPNVLTQKEVSS